MMIQMRKHTFDAYDLIFKTSLSIICCYILFTKYIKYTKIKSNITPSPSHKYYDSSLVLCGLVVFSKSVLKSILRVGNRYIF